jgi:hypothetical protein
VKNFKIIFNRLVSRSSWRWNGAPTSFIDENEMALGQLDYLTKMAGTVSTIPKRSDIGCAPAGARGRFWAVIPVVLVLMM